MSAVAFAEAVLALIPEGIQQFDGEVVAVDGTVPAAPWVSVTIQLPNRTERAMARVGLVKRVVVRFVICAGTAGGVRVIADQLDPAIEGAALTFIPGWKTTRLEQINAREPEEDRALKIAGTNRHPAWGVLEYAFIATRTTTTP